VPHVVEPKIEGQGAGVSLASGGGVSGACVFSEFPLDPRCASLGFGANVIASHGKLGRLLLIPGRGELTSLSRRQSGRCHAAFLPSSRLYVTATDAGGRPAIPS
jgi:hypothetical protein